MKKLLLKNNIYTLVDDEDYEYLKQFKWQSFKNGYIFRMPSRKLGKRKPIYLHREIMKCPKELEVDHINLDKMDNRKCNLRICSKKENNRNTSKCKRKTFSKYKGVSLVGKNDKWRAYITVENKFINLGSFEDEKEAAKAYNKAAIEHFGEFAKINEGLK